MTSLPHFLTIEPLTVATFAPFGDVIEVSDNAQHFAINAGYAERYHDLAQLDVAVGGGRPIVSIFRAQPRQFPLQLSLLERHPLGSQAFVALSTLPFLVVVAPAGVTPPLVQLRCFRAASGQGVNYARGIWHHPLIALQVPSDFLVLDRGGQASDANCDIYPISDQSLWLA
ncbi:MAG: ureidoglycolate lyase [Rhodoferax sp.]|jgi:ureidoglycolate lyase